MEDHAVTWLWMGFALMALAVNLIYPRSRILKAAGLIFLVLAAALYAFFAEVEIVRDLSAASSLSHHPTPEPASMSVVKWLDIVDMVASYGLLDLWLVLCGGIFFSLVPSDAFTRMRKHGSAVKPARP